MQTFLGDRTLGRRVRRIAAVASVAVTLVLVLTRDRVATAHAAGGATSGPGGIEARAAMDDVQVAAFARAFQAAVLAHDGDGLVSLFRADATIRERNAVVAAGSARVAEWVQACVARRFTLDPSSLRLTAQGATWAFSDASGCYERTRPGAFSVSRDLGPAGGVVELTLRNGQIDTLIFTYSPEWEARRIASMAAPVRAAQEAQARRMAMPAPLATPLPLDEPAVATPPVAPQDTQGRTTPPLAPWIVGAFGAVMTAFGALRRPSRPRQGQQAK